MSVIVSCHRNNFVQSALYSRPLTNSARKSRDRLFCWTFFIRTYLSVWWFWMFTMMSAIYAGVNAQSQFCKSWTLSPRTLCKYAENCQSIYWCWKQLYGRYRQFIQIKRFVKVSNKVQANREKKSWFNFHFQARVGSSINLNVCCMNKFVEMENVLCYVAWINTEYWRTLKTWVPNENQKVKKQFSETGCLFVDSRDWNLKTLRAVLRVFFSTYGFIAFRWHCHHDRANFQ